MRPKPLDGNQCDRCGHVWYSGENIPLRCANPKCKSPYWNAGPAGNKPSTVVRVPPEPSPAALAKVAAKGRPPILKPKDARAENLAALKDSAQSVVTALEKQAETASVQANIRAMKKEVGKIETAIKQEQEPPCLHPARERVGHKCQKCGADDVTTGLPVRGKK